MMHEQYKHAAVEALILASPEPLPTRKITQLVEEITPSQVAEAITKLNSGYVAAGCSFRIREIAGGYQFYVLPEYVRFIEDMFSSRRRLRLSRAALETVAIVAYRQPVTKADIEHIRGVASDGVVRTLLEKSLITVDGRADTVGKPLQYGTTDEFLKFFGLARLEDLPKMSEIEQLISATESKDQTELMLEITRDGKEVKLNVADGTFDPAEREADEEGAEGSVEAAADAEAVDENSADSGEENIDKSDDHADIEAEANEAEAESEDIVASETAADGHPVRLVLRNTAGEEIVQEVVMDSDEAFEEDDESEIRNSIRNDMGEVSEVSDGDETETDISEDDALVEHHSVAGES